jgi:hypothetical protein
MIRFIANPPSVTSSRRKTRAFHLSIPLLVFLVLPAGVEVAAFSAGDRR